MVLQYNITDRCYALSVTNINRAVMRLVIADQLTAFFLAHLIVGLPYFKTK